MQKVLNNPGLLRDPKNNALVSVNCDQYYAAKARKLKNKKQRNSLEEIQKDLKEIKSALTNIINTLNENTIKH